MRRRWNCGGGKNGRGGRVPVIALTVNAIEGERERCLWVGMDDYLLKPVRFADLAAKLERWLPRDEDGETAEAAAAGKAA